MLWTENRVSRRFPFSTRVLSLVDVPTPAVLVLKLGFDVRGGSPYRNKKRREKETVGKRVKEGWERVEKLGC